MILDTSQLQINIIGGLGVSAYLQLTQGDILLLRANEKGSHKEIIWHLKTFFAQTDLSLDGSVSTCDVCQNHRYRMGCAIANLFNNATSNTWLLNWFDPISDRRIIRIINNHFDVWIIVEIIGRVALTSAHPEMVDCGSDQGRSVFATAGVAGLRRKKMNGYAIIAETRERRTGPQDAISGWALIHTPDGLAIPDPGLDALFGVLPDVVVNFDPIWG